MSSEIAIRARGLSKSYRIYARPHDRLLQFMFGRRKKYFSDFSALDNVSFEIERGAAVGILGRNGAGKSTLLQIICGTLTPSAGEVQVSGRIGALLELGTGFNPEFTGHENIYLNASILGLSREEIDARYDRIIGFADIGDFIQQPVKTYSSGMAVRLAFAVAINIDPEVLIVDEALSVGDIKFQSKCFRKFEELRANGVTILFVTHSPEQVNRHCDKALLLDQGKLVSQGSPQLVTNQYLDLMFGVSPIREAPTPEPVEPTAAVGPEVISESKVDSTRSNGASSGGALKQFLADESKVDKASSRPGYNNSEYRWGNQKAKIIDYLICCGNDYFINHFTSVDSIEVYVRTVFFEDVAEPIYGLTIKTPDGVIVYGTNSRDWDGRLGYVPVKRNEVKTVRFSLTPKLASGHYLISLGLVEEGSDEVTPLDRRYDLIEIYITNTSGHFGIADLGMEVAVL